MEFYLVGGAVRDEIMGRRTNDHDFTVVLPKGSYQDAFVFMTEELERRGFKIFVTNPEFLTARAKFPKGHVNENMVADFVLARKESGYVDGRRPTIVSPGSLTDDLARRDFCMNSIAKAEDGSYIDPYDGQDDIAARVIRCVGNPTDRFTEDSLRILRALRFSVTLGFRIDYETTVAINECYTLLSNVSVERINDEVGKMFNHHTPAAINVLFYDFANVGQFLVNTVGLRLTPTMKK